MTYEEMAEELNRILEYRRKISTSRSGLLPIRGKEAEHEKLTREADVIRRLMRRKRYGTE